MHSSLRFAVTGLLLCFFGSVAAHACPRISGIPDFNCDGELRIAVMGDSLVYGTGDSANAGKGGYVVRLGKALPRAEVSNLGVPGAHSQDLLALLEDAFDRGREPEVRAALNDADIVILDLGRNDRWEFGAPIRTFRNLKKAAKRITSEVISGQGISPIVVTAVLFLPNRGSQGPWVKELNQLILKGSTALNPCDLRFDLVDKHLLNPDGIHPTSAGYKAVASVLLKYIKKSLTKKMVKLRVDTDADGIPDLIETAKFLTDPEVFDTDGDGRGDGEEIFTTLTDPLVANL